jgi:hypothetical protein
MTMRTLTKAALLALALAGASGAANAQSFGFYIGPDGARIGYTQEYYYDRYHHRHMYRYPSDWRTYHHPLAWYRTHPYWYRDHDWYRRY